MGNLCSKSSPKDSPFDRPGRVLGSAPDQPARAPVPQQVKANHPVSGPGRTLASPGTTAPDANDPRTAAAKAAEARATQSQGKGKGKLAEQLAAQKAQTRSDTLAQVSSEERGARNQDANAAARAWN